MAYLGIGPASSVPSTLQNPPALLARPLSGGGRFVSSDVPMQMGLWMYRTTDVSSSPFTAGWFSDGYQLGMKQGDVVITVGMITTVASSQYLNLGVVSSVSSTGGGTQLSTFSFISST